MPPTILTRSQKATKPSETLKETRKHLPSSVKQSSTPTNVSLITISKVNETKKSPRKSIETSNIISDLRDKLATTQFSLKQLEQEYSTIQQKLTRVTELNNLYKFQIDEHKCTIATLSNKIQSRCLRDSATQTEQDTVNTNTQTCELIDGTLPVLMENELDNELLQDHNIPNQTKNSEMQARLPVDDTSVSKRKKRGLTPALAQNDHHNNTKKNNNIKLHNKTRVLFLSDSHGRKINETVNTLLNKTDVYKNNIEITNFFKPNANFLQVTYDIGKLVANFNKSDHVIITAGSNDFKFDTFIEAVQNVIEICAHTNLLINSIPYRYDKPSANRFIYKQNSHILNMSQEYNFKFNDLNIFLRRNDYTKHGLHFNGKGKVIMASTSLQYVYILGPATTFLNPAVSYNLDE